MVALTIKVVSKFFYMMESRYEEVQI